MRCARRADGRGVPQITESAPPPPPPRSELTPASGYAPERRHKRQLGKSDGLLAIWSGLCLVLAILGGGSGVAFVLMFFIWVGPAFCLTIIYLLARSGRRKCPACGNGVKVGLTACPTCQHDFASAARGLPT